MKSFKTKKFANTCPVKDAITQRLSAFAYALTAKALFEVAQWRPLHANNRLFDHSSIIELLWLNAERLVTSSHTSHDSV